MQTEFGSGGDLKKQIEDPDPENRKFVKGSSGALVLAAKKLSDIGWHPLRELKDPKGIFCIEYPKFYLTANGYLYKGSIVSNQKEVIYRAKKNRKKLVVYIADKDKFYIFDPEDILVNYWENNRGYLVMYNWYVSLGRDFLS